MHKNNSASYAGYSDPFFQATPPFKYMLFVRGYIVCMCASKQYIQKFLKGGMGHWDTCQWNNYWEYFKNDVKFHRERDHPLNCPCCYRLVCRKIGTVWFIFDWVSWFVWSTTNSSLLHSRSFCGHATLFTGDERCVTTQRWATWRTKGNSSCLIFQL